MAERMIREDQCNKIPRYQKWALVAVFLGSIAIIFSVLSLVTHAHAQTVPPTQQMTMQQIEDLNSALKVLDQGTLDQCAPKAAPKDDKPGAQDRPCPFHKSTALLRAMARDMIALQPFDSEYKVQQNAVRMEMQAAITIPDAIIAASAGSAPQKTLNETAINSAVSKQDAAFFAKLTPLLEEKRNVPGLAHITMSDLDLGDTPDHNRMPAAVIGGLSSIIDDFATAK